MKDDKSIPLTRAIGRFFGHLAGAVKADPANSKDQTEVNRTVEQQQAQTPEGQSVTLRRTTIEEIEIENDRR